VQIVEWNRQADVLYQESKAQTDDLMAQFQVGVNTAMSMPHRHLVLTVQYFASMARTRCSP
jgi:hypothetical protein